MIKNLIFDLGFHNGDDSDFYLAKGFDVVAVEANPVLYKAGKARFKQQILSDKIALLNKAVADTNGSINFYVHPKHDDWGSCQKWLAEIGGTTAQVFKVDSINLATLFYDYGVPYYMKVDIEGHDTIVARALVNESIKPKFVSFETAGDTYPEIFSNLYLAGYRSFCLVNQLNQPIRSMPEKVREGMAIEYSFSKYASGLFGNDLPQDSWISYEEMLSRYIKYRELKKIDNKELGLGWLDVHAKLG